MIDQGKAVVAGMLDDRGRSLCYLANCLTQRDWLAGLAMQGLLSGALSSVSDDPVWSFDNVADDAYKWPTP